MAGNTRSIPFHTVNKHPDDSILLAYLRGQQLEFRSSVIQHIDIDKCPRCLHKLNELKQVSDTLDTLGVMRPYQHYPELSAVDTYARMQNAVMDRIPARTATNGARYRQRPRKSAVRLISVPAAFGLAILFTMAMLVFANLSGKSLLPRSLQGGTSASQNNSTSFPRQQSTPPPNLALTATANVDASATPVLTPTTTPVTGPYIEVCSTSINIARWRLVICGYNFEAGYKVTLVAPGKTPIVLSNPPVDKQGDFKVGWNIGNCGNLPSAIIAYEVVNTRPISARLRNISFGSCPVQTPTSRAN